MSEQDGWINLACANRAYTDIIFYNEKLYALANNGSVEAWDFRGKFPKKVMEIAPSFIIDEEEHMNFPFDKFSAQLYLVESKGEILLTKRYIGNFVNANGVALYEADLLTVDDTHPLVCPYRTKSFSLYKLDFIKIKWEKKESLDDQVLFLGGNHSMSLSARDFCNEFEANSIYFTDDKWDEMNEDYLYGGHDLGVFSFKDGKTKPLHLCEMDRIDPPPFWIVPIM
ncbi:F-box protein [Quillaja saponaria]|uniref:F-box protein n=1 Tax=Quillaja saponaria TaxID=32244 RepID=A0AAD7L593_QUISA|nr:F-box protein [Quillaja saponaria]